MKEALCLFSGYHMFSRSQERLLRYLGGFPEGLEQAWDVPRDLSLPGLADAMGMVRSGLNQPLTGLLDGAYVTVRVAHVIGGGSRRRQVYHITKKGRAWLEEHPAEALETTSSAPSSTSFLVGREATLSALASKLENDGRAVLGGLSGVGKTAVLKAIQQATGAGGTTVRWADIDEFCDAQTVFTRWFAEEGPAPTDSQSLLEAAVLAKANSLFIVDDLHRLDPRHADEVVALLNGMHDRGCSLLLASRLPLIEGLDWPVHRLSTLEPDEASALLGEHLSAEQRLAVAKALGGHPMAINLYREGDPLPEAGADIQAFVEATMLNTLDESERLALDQMVLFPRPLPAEVAPGSDAVEALDDRALLRWSGATTSFEVQHLVRNVRRTMLSETDLIELHQRALNHWNQHNDRPEYGVIRLYHALALGSEDVHAMMNASFEALVEADAAALAVVFERATQERPKDGHLHYWAGRVATQRQELDHARRHLANVDEPALQDDLRHALAVMEGDAAEAQRLLERQLDRASSLERNRLVLRAAVQRVDDRLFNERTPLEVAALRSLLERVELPDDMEMRSSIMVSMTMIQHSLALAESDTVRARALVEQLLAVSHETDPLVLLMDLKTRLHFGNEAEGPSVSEADVVRVLEAQTSPFHRAAVGLTYAEHLFNHDPERAAAWFANVVQPQHLKGPASSIARYTARWWYLAGHVGARPVALALREAARWFRQAGCPQASRAVTQRLHRVL